MGLLICAYGLYSAVISASPYWYSWFVVGWFLFLDRLDAAINADANLTRLLKGQWQIPAYTYGTYLAGALLIDVLLGSYIGNLWFYPRFNAAEKIINVILIGYPFAFFSCAALFRVLVGLLHRLGAGAPPAAAATSALAGLGKVLLALTIGAILAPLVYFWIFGRKDVQEIIGICAVIGIFSWSPLSLLLGQNCLLQGILTKD